MTTTCSLDVPTLTDALRDTLRHGARASVLSEHAPGLVRMLTPDDEGSLDERALTAERMIRDGVTALGEPTSTAMTILLGLDSRTWHRGIEKRRASAANILEITPGAFRRPRHQGTYLRDIAWEIWRTHRRDA